MTHAAPRRRARLGVAATAVLLGGTGILTTAPGRAAASTNVQHQSAAVAGGYLARQISADGAVHEVPYGSTTPAANTGDTVRALIGLAVSGHGASAFERGEDYLTGAAAAYLGVGTTGYSSGKTGLVLLAAAVGGRDTASYVSTLESDQGSDGHFSDANGYVPVEDQSLGLLGLAAAHVHDTATTSALSWLESQQCADGAFPGTTTHAAGADCVSGDDDVQSTAYAVEALAGFGITSGGGYDSSTAVTFLHGVQHADAGWGTYGAGSGSESDSTGDVAAALASLGINPDGPTFARGNATPASYLRSVQASRTSDSTNDGAYTYDGVPADDYGDVLSTSEGLPGQLGVTLPRGRVVLSDDEPRADVPAPPTTTPPTTTTPPASGTHRPTCVAVTNPQGRPEVVPVGCVRRAANATPCVVYYAAKTFRKSVRPVGCLPEPNNHTPCNVTYDRQHRKSVLPVRCEPLFRRS